MLDFGLVPFGGVKRKYLRQMQERRNIQIEISDDPGSMEVAYEAIREMRRLYTKGHIIIIPVAYS